MKKREERRRRERKEGEAKRRSEKEEGREKGRKGKEKMKMKERKIKRRGKEEEEGAEHRTTTIAGRRCGTGKEDVHEDEKCSSWQSHFVTESVCSFEIVFFLRNC